MEHFPLVIIGAGAAGLVIAVGAAKAGKKVLVINKGPFGGDCTNFGCIPSKSLIASAHIAHAIKNASELGITTSNIPFNADLALNRVKDIVEDIRMHEDSQALEKLGIVSRNSAAYFEDARTLNVQGEKISFDQLVIAAGSSPLIPTIPGLEQTPYLTNETIFDLKSVPKSLAILGGGPIGCELAQAFTRLGTQVFLFHSHDKLLNKEEPEAQEVIFNQFKKEGMKFYLGEKIHEVTYTNSSFHISLSSGSNVEVDCLLVAVGRKPNVAGLNLSKAGIAFSDQGIEVNSYGRTTQKHIWAVGDIVGRPFFTHHAEHQARTILTSLVMPLPLSFKLDNKQPIPRVTFTDPEVASIGLLEEEAKKNHSIAVYHVPFSAVDRALTEGRTEGFIKVVTKKWSSKILGCTIVGPRAGEMLGEVSTAMLAGIPLRKLAKLIHPYPTYNQAIRKAADLWLTQTILPNILRKIR